MFRVPNQHRLRTGPLGTTESAGNNGIFVFRHGGLVLRCIASDGLRWEHVSVSVQGAKRTPTWEEMCAVKDLFWDDTDCAVQYHPPKDDYVNCHPYVLHLWRPIGLDVPRPPSIMVGPK